MFWLPVVALLLGIKHSYDADHIIAVSNLLSRTKSFQNTVKMSLSWAAGHMLTATAVTVLLYYFKESFLSAFLSQFEFAVAIMLIVLGVVAFKDVGLFHSHKHAHDEIVHSHRHIHLRGRGQEHYHKHMFGIGIVHGLASNDELLLLFTVSLSLSTLFGILLGVAIFSIGVVAGMVVYGMVLNYPLIRLGSERIRRAVNIVAGSVSIGYGVLLAVTL